MATICPYCNIEVSESAIEAEDGCCPECGSVISASSSFLGEDPSEFDDGINDSFHTEPARFELFPDRIGAKAAQRLLQLIHGSDETPHRIDVPFDFIPGKSVRTQK